MSTNPSKSGPRPGGRAARVQAAVHDAARALLAERGRDDLTVPLIASRAGVTPSTIYRRWGDITELLADVAVERLRPDGEPADTGGLTGDLRSWSEQYLDEMSSEVGVAMMRDVLASGAAPSGIPIPCRCAEFTAAQIEIMLTRARERGESGIPTVEALMDGIVAPIIYRVLFGPAPPDAAWLHERLAVCLKTGTMASSSRHCPPRT
ncbi:MAG TPA: TetR/AcrR family transcriptional regulator [Candidatus Aquabacterium excrementipullorum]|nr:TetR/AcrR family transcriptional regulator [Candidatus Aquabacterium excrementipullorum]